MGGSEVAVGHSFCKNLPRHLAVYLQPLGLFVLFVPVQPQPFQAVKDRLHRRLSVPLGVGIVQAKDHGSTGVTGIEPVENEGTGATYVEKPSRRRGETNSNGSG